MAVVWTAATAGVLGAGAAWCGWVAPARSRVWLSSALGLLAGVLLLLAIGGSAPGFAGLTWALAAVFPLICWRLFLPRVRLAAVHVVGVMACLLPGCLLLIRTLPPQTAQVPLQWLSPQATTATLVLVGLHFLGLGAPVVSLWMQLRASSAPAAAWKAMSAALGGLGLLLVGVGLAAHTDLLRWTVPPVAMLLGGSLTWHVVGSSRSGGSTEPAASTDAAQVTMLVGRTATRLGRELAAAHTQARAMEDTLPSAASALLEPLLVTLAEGNRLAGVLSVGADAVPPRRTTVLLSELVQRVVVFVGRGDASVARVEGATDLPPIWGMSVVIERALQALVQNALDAQAALEEDTPVHIQWQRAVVQEPPPGLRVGRLPEGDYARVVISDRGDGLSAEAAARCIEPFFSTRSGHEGIGLLQVLHLIQLEGGGFGLDTRNGATRAVLWLPLRSPPLPTRHSPPSPILLTPEEDVLEVIFVGTDPRLQDLFGVLAEARGLRWGQRKDVRALVAHPTGPRADGVVVCVDPVEAGDVQLLTRWLAPRLVFVAASSESIASLVAAGMSAEAGFALASFHAREVMGLVEAVSTHQRA